LRAFELHEQRLGELRGNQRRLRGVGQVCVRAAEGARDRRRGRGGGREAEQTGRVEQQREIVRAVRQQVCVEVRGGAGARVRGVRRQLGDAREEKEQVLVRAIEKR
jgi:hypothetical protein